MEMLAVSDADFQLWTAFKPPAKAKQLWPGFVVMMQELMEQGGDVPGQIERVLEFCQPLLEEKYDDPDRRLADLEQLQQIAAKFDERTEMLSDLTIDPPTSESDLPGGAKHRDHLVLSTIHSAKGLEWQAVYVLHASEGMIPQERSFDDVDAVREERRMFYVALTRAADWLYVCHAQVHFQRSGYGGWNRWDDDGFRELTRFLSPRAQQCFDRQTASQFVPPDSLVASQSKSPSPRKSRRKKKKSRQARQG